MNTAKLNYQDFIRELKSTLYFLIPKDVQLEIYPVLKNNSLHLDSLVLRRENTGTSPNFYLQEYYEQYKTGRPINSLAEDIMVRWKEIGDNIPLWTPDMNFERCKQNIVYRLVSAKRNQELLEEIPYIPFQDLAVIFYYLVIQDEEGIGGIRINNGLMESWGINIRILAECAGKNTPRLFPARCNPISRVLEQIIFQSEGDMRNFQGCPSDEPYILTNSNGINGAAVWLYPKLMEELAGFFGKNLYILPSSIHELLIVPDDGKLLQKDMLCMVAQVNRECVLPEDILSDNIYYYDKKKQLVNMIENDS